MELWAEPVLLQSLHQQQHPTDASGPVGQTHEEEEQQRDEGGLDGPLHQQGHAGTAVVCSGQVLRLEAVLMFLWFCLCCRGSDITGGWTANASLYFRMRREPNTTG